MPISINASDHATSPDAILANVFSQAADFFGSNPVALVATAAGVVALLLTLIAAKRRRQSADALTATPPAPMLGLPPSLESIQNAYVQCVSPAGTASFQPQAELAEELKIELPNAGETRPNLNGPEIPPPLNRVVPAPERPAGAVSSANSADPFHVSAAEQAVRLANSARTTASDNDAPGPLPRRTPALAAPQTFQARQSWAQAWQQA
ncbi:MAG: hypothetical protein LBG11_10265 [Bifidobacteriaceae bacterium]|nr:hypothetical protein [Bifidobacteriaceae bacterium]